VGILSVLGASSQSMFEGAAKDLSALASRSGLDDGQYSRQKWSRESVHHRQERGEAPGRCLSTSKVICPSIDLRCLPSPKPSPESSYFFSIIVPLSADVRSQESLHAAAQRVRDESGYINLLICNAGTAGPGVRGMSPRSTIKDFVQSAWSTPTSAFTDVYDLNCTGVYYTVLAFLELLGEGNARRKPGEPKSQVIAMSSMVAFQRDPRYGFAYCSSKAALVSMMKCFATHCVSWDIRFNTIAAGCMWTASAVFVNQLNSGFSISDEPLGTGIDAFQDLEREAADRRRRLRQTLHTGGACRIRR
jgi:NAD(P)-dependent dehydrogenase (short-subunit alcohol dehydrogenase family)